MDRDDECFPDLECRCCACRGRHCMIWHPGHDHRFPESWETDLEGELREMLEAAKRLASKTEDDDNT